MTSTPRGVAAAVRVRSTLRWPTPVGWSLAACIVLGGCAGDEVLAPVGRVPEHSARSGSESGTHRVRSGETLYSIAWRYGLDYRELSRWNAVPEPYVIYPGQRLRITRPAQLPPMPQASRSTRTQTGPRARTTPDSANGSPTPGSSAKSARGRTAAPPPRDDRAVSAWRWPAQGKIVGAFSGEGGKGIDIAGRRGDPVVAAAGGRVVYSGSGLRGYGKLIIVKHNKRYLSAYAHNDRLHAKEGDTVKSGQRIADMGSTDAKSVKLHFEIRRDGQPVDPTRFLPR